MSASLVGSEMCIRDRYPLCIQRDELLCMLMLRQNTDAQSTPNQQAVPRAVSYTHLTLPTICSV
eukprot:2810288-Alexandrium_andersonii.AAC.1